jgi:hypothetical protein
MAAEWFVRACSDQELLVSDLVMGSGLAQAAVKAGQLQV